MSATLEASYQPLQPYGPELGEAEETPQDSGVMIHVVPENSRGTFTGNRCMTAASVAVQLFVRDLRFL
jgi:hypothetical protein